MTEPYDSTAATLAHIARVQELLHRITLALTDRGQAHDASKLSEPEKSAFDHATPFLATAAYGTPAYEDAKAQLGEALAHHYRKNAHHPEHFDPVSTKQTERMQQDLDILIRLTETGKRPESAELAVIQRAHEQLAIDLQIAQSRINRMSLLDILEMIADWKAAGERTANGNLADSLAFNRQKHAIGDQLFAILENTAKELGWI